MISLGRVRKIMHGQLVPVEGSPGIGKTTLCLKLCHDWANGAIARNFPSFKLVFLLKCRDMKGDIAEDIFEQLLPEDLKEITKNMYIEFVLFDEIIDSEIFNFLFFF